MSKRFTFVLLVEALLCILFCLLRVNYTGLFSAAVAFPMEQIGAGLRWLSVSGMAGNVLAVVCYVLICLLPSGIWCILKKREKACGMDAILIGISILLFFLLYFMVNPGLFGSTDAKTAKMMLGGTFYSVLVGYLMLRILKMYASADAIRLASGLTRLLGVLNMAFVYLICSQELGVFLAALEKLQSENSSASMMTEVFGANSYLTMTYVFLALHYAVAVLPYLLNMAVVFLAADMIRKLALDRCSDGAVAAAKKLSAFCVKALIATVAADAAFNLLQLLFRKKLYRMDIVVQVPVFSLIFALAALLLAEYIREMQKVKRENDLFI